MVFCSPRLGARATGLDTFKNHSFLIGKHGFWSPQLLIGGARDGPRNLQKPLFSNRKTWCVAAPAPLRGRARRPQKPCRCDFAYFFLFSALWYVPYFLFSVRSRIFCFLFSAEVSFTIFCFLFSVRGCVFSYFLFSAFCSLVWGFAYFLISVFCLPVCVSSMWDTSHPGIRQIAVLVHDSW